ncbi:MAG: dTDP-4-dehydrorhamnose 3,5-epimerase [Muribaculaceae bacterium]|nr:dTDP-4-dehydrorhamnose 3,5-epimerase [Muribaculaceae bacterium]
MEITKLDIEGLVIIEPRVFHDDRGYFFESFSQREFNEKVAPTVFVQDNESKSVRGVVRGLHFQCPPHAQAKLVRCVVGCVIDIALDIRKGSPTYGKYAAVELSADNHRQFFIPEGFAHGFAVVSDTAVFQYKCNNYYAPTSEGGVDINDLELGIELPIDFSQRIFSEKDLRHPKFKDFVSPFNFSTTSRQ